MHKFFKGIRTGLSLLACLVSSVLMAQEAALKGKVTDEKGNPLVGVTTVVKGNSGGFSATVQTNFEGLFSVDKLPVGGTYTVTCTYVGYQDKVLSGNQYSGTPVFIEITMEPIQASGVDEVVVVGYGRAARRDVTGSVKSVKAGDFNKGIINAPEELLQGKVSGVNVTSASGEPGAIQNITVRGPGGIRSGVTPLFVIDGLALDNTSTGGATNPLAFINPQDIESIDVLKDASATAIYGARGANGVILVTTKKGKQGFSSVTYNVTAGISQLARALPVFETEQYKAEVRALGGTVEDFGGSTNWQDEITRTAFTQNHNLTLSGGAGKFSYFGSFGLQNQEGIIRENTLKRYNGRINITQKLIDDKWILEANISANNTVNTRPPIQGIIGNAISLNPTLPARNSDGSLFSFDNGINPLLQMQINKDVTTINRVIGNITSSLTLLKGLVYKLNYGIDNSTGTRDIQDLPNARPLVLGGLSTFNNYNRNSLIENYLTYNFSTGAHKFNTLLGHSYQKIFVQGRGFSISRFPNANVEPIYNPGLGQELTLATNRPTGYAFINELQSFFGRVNYSYKNKYLLTATFRADGSSKFGDNNKYGYFPSFGAAWVLSEEDFFKSSIISNLKLRAGWGRTGNQEIPPKITQPLFTSTVSGTTSYPLYPTGSYPGGTNFTRLANPDIQWEVSNQTDIGLDFGLFDGKLNGTIDYFRKVSNNILLEVIPADPVQPASTVWTNVEDMEIINKGFEVDLNYRHPFRNGFTFTIGGNLTLIDNVVENSPYSVIPSGSASGSGLTSATINGYVSGQPIGTFFLREFIGFNESGLSQYRDVNGDGIVNDNDRVALGTALPSTLFNLYGTAEYKGFDLSANFNGVSGNKIYDNTANSSFYKLLLSKGVNTTPEAIQYAEESINNAAPVSSRFLKEGRFFRLNNLTLGYNFNTQKLGLNKWVKGLRVAFTGQNLWITTPYNGYDPEVNTDRSINGITSYGIDYLSYPKASSFLFNLQVTF